VLYAGGVAVGAMRARVPGTPEHAMRVYSRFDVDKAYVKNVHLSTSKVGKVKFGGTRADAESILKATIVKGDIMSIANNGLSSMEKQSYGYIINAGKAIGTKSEQYIRLALSVDGGFITAFPYNTSYFKDLSRLTVLM
jgi:hypothetical protein